MSIEAASMIENEDNDNFPMGHVMSVVGGHLVNDSYAAFIPTMLPLLIDKLSLSLTMAGTLSALYQIPAIFNPIIGYLVEYNNLFLLVPLAPAFTATLISCLGLAPTPWILAIILFTGGISTSIFHAPAPALIGSIAPKKLGRGMSLFMAAGELGYTLGPLLIVWAVGTWTLEGTYRLMFIGWAASLFLFLRFRNYQRPFKSTQTSLAFSEIKGMLPRFYRFFIPMAALLFMRNFIVTLIAVYIPTYMKARGASLFLSGASLSINEMAGVIGALLGGWMSDRWGRNTVLSIAMSVSFLFLLTIQFTQGWISILALACLGFSSLSTGPILLAIVQEHFPQVRGIANGFYMGSAFLIQSIGAVIIGFMGDHLGLNPTFFWCGILSLFSIPLVFTLPRSKAN